MQSEIFMAIALVMLAHTGGQLYGYGKHQRDYDDDDYHDDDYSRQWENGYEKWRLQCAKYPLLNGTNVGSTDDSGITTRIIGGNLAEPDMLPYQVALLLVQPPANLVQCGGALISASFVLTAAHCLFAATRGIVYLGTTRYADEMSAAAVYNVSRRDFYIYESYFGPGSYHDLALVKLPAPVTFNAAIQPIRLARSYMTQALLEGAAVITSGWGYTSDAAAKTGATNTLLYYVELYVLEQVKCECYFLPGLVNVRSHICVDGSAMRGGCDGDSGGPLVYNYRNINYLIGVTAFGSAGGCQIGWPTVFTRLTNYLTWIEHRTGIKVD